MARWSDVAYLLLAALAADEDHGYALAQRIDHSTDGDVRISAGMLYGTLDKLQDADLIELAREEVVDGRQRRIYSITAMGREALRARLARLENQAVSIRAALGPT